MSSLPSFDFVFSGATPESGIRANTRTSLLKELENVRYADHIEI
jgi:hypothetical protein